MVEDITYNMVTVEEDIFMTVDIPGGMGNMVMVLMDGCITEGLLMVVGMITFMAEDIIHIDVYFHGGAAGILAILAATLARDHHEIVIVASARLVKSIYI